MKALRGRKLTPKHRDLVTCFASYFFQCLEYYSTLPPAEGPLGGITCALRFLESMIRSVSFTECKSSTLNPKNIHQTPFKVSCHPGGNMASCVGVHPKIHQVIYLESGFHFSLFHKTWNPTPFEFGKQNGRPPKRHQTSNKRHRGSYWTDGSDRNPGFSLTSWGKLVVDISHYLPWEPKTFIFRGYNPYVGGVKPSFFMVLGSKGKRF